MLKVVGATKKSLLGLKPKGSMYPNSIYLSLKVVSILVLWAKVYTIWVHGSFGLGIRVQATGLKVVGAGFMAGGERSAM